MSDTMTFPTTDTWLEMSHKEQQLLACDLLREATERQSPTNAIERLRSPNMDKALRIVAEAYGLAMRYRWSWEWGEKP